MTQRTTLPGTFTGALAATLPKFVTSAPVTAGLIRRYSVETLDKALVGTPIASLPDVQGGSALAQGAASKRPVLREVAGVRYLEFDGVDDELRGSTVGAGIRTVAAVVRFRAALAPQSDNWPVLGLASAGVGAYSLNASGTMNAYSSAVLTGGGAPGTTAHVFLATFNGASSIVRVDGTEVAGNTGSLPPAGEVNVGTGTAVGSFAKLDAYEWFIWDRALDLTERNKVITDLRAKYGI